MTISALRKFPDVLSSIICEYALPKSFPGTGFAEYTKLFKQVILQFIRHEEVDTTVDGFASRLTFANEQEQEKGCIAAGTWGNGLLEEVLKTKNISINLAQARWKVPFKAILAKQDEEGEILFRFTKAPDLPMWWQYALEYGHLPLLKTLQSRGCDVHASLNRPLLSHREINYWGGDMEEIASSEDVTYPITRVTEAGHVEAVKWLLNFRVRIDVQGSMEDTPFQMACAGKEEAHTKILELFLQANITLETATALCSKQSPFKVAGNAGTITLLQKHYS